MLIGVHRPDHRVQVGQRKVICCSKSWYGCSRQVYVGSVSRGARTTQRVAIYAASQMVYLDPPSQFIFPSEVLQNLLPHLNIDRGVLVSDSVEEFSTACS